MVRRRRRPSRERSLVYDDAGIAARHVLDELREPHGALWSGETLMVVSTGTNAILRIPASGGMAGRWQAPGRGDCWHLNSLSWCGRRPLVSAFGRFREHHGWAGSAARAGRGVVIDVRSGRDVLGGLSAPHNPLWLDRSWLICNSDRGEVIRLDGTGTLLCRRRFAGWTRGLAYDAEHVYVGERSSPPQRGAGQRLRRGDDAGPARGGRVLEHPEPRDL